MKLNVYIDGSWLFKQCDRGKILANRTESPDASVLIDFEKLLSLLEHRAALYYQTPVERGELLMCTSIFAIREDVETWPYVRAAPIRIAKLRANVNAREQFIQAAVGSGFSDRGILRPTLRPWVLRAIVEGTYQEKQVDTFLVAHLVERAVREQDSVHFLATGDADMLPGIQTVVPEYTKRVVLILTHPLQVEREEQQTSFVFENFRLSYGPIYLEDTLEQLIQGQFVYRCRTPTCLKIFTRAIRPTGPAEGLCRACAARVASRGRTSRWRTGG